MKRSELEAIIEEEIHTYLEYFSQLNERKNAIPSKDAAPVAQASPTPTKGAPDKKEKKDKPEFKYDRKKANQKRDPRKKKDADGAEGKRKVGAGRKGAQDSAGTVPSIHNRKMTADQIKKRAKLGDFLLNKLRRGKRENNEFYKRVVAHARKKLELGDEETPSTKEIFSFVWAIASDMVLRGATVDKEGRARRKKAKADKKKAQGAMKKKMTGGGSSDKEQDPDQLSFDLKGGSRKNQARKKRTKDSTPTSPSKKKDATQLPLRLRKPATKKTAKD
jgi:hypothetical protein